jgi:hypothetical protein
VPAAHGFDLIVGSGTTIIVPLLSSAISASVIQ